MTNLELVGAIVPSMVLIVAATVAGWREWAAIRDETCRLKNDTRELQRDVQLLRRELNGSE